MISSNQFDIFGMAIKFYSLIQSTRRYDKLGEKSCFAQSLYFNISNIFFIFRDYETPGLRYVRTRLMKNEFFQISHVCLRSKINLKKKTCYKFSNVVHDLINIHTIVQNFVKIFIEIYLNKDIFLSKQFTLHIIYK